ncbi:MAG: hypothetical protein QOC77_1559 [Thermoleophilaceae bacterium]|nr:hypothetical protein [Thermoleophilaceae bacterium]
MTRRLFLPISLLALALLVPLTARAASVGFGTVAAPAGAAAAGSPRATLRKAQSALLDGRGVRKGSEVTPLLKQLALKLPSLTGSERKRAVRLLERPTQGQGGTNELEYEVPEQAPFCSAHFCVHWVKTTDDAPSLTDSNHDGVPDYVETMSQVFEHVYSVENDQLGWKPPKSDGTRGCAANAPANCPDKTDVYIKEVGSQGIYGYSAPDPGQQSYHQFAYLVMDDDYNATQFPRYGGDPLQPMEVTAAHEYNHVLQFNYDTAQDTWMFESSAVWMEDRVYTDVNDYLQYLTPWSQMTFVPLTYFASGDDPLNVKVYGDGVWNRWLETHFGDNAIRDAWAVSRNTAPKSFAPAAYGTSLLKRGSSFYSAFSTFAADTAEWRAANTPFAEGVTFPDVDRAASSSSNRPITLTADGVGASGRLSHTAYVLLDVEPPASLPQLKLAVNTPRGTRMAIALVGRTGDEVNGTSTRFLKLLPNGGPGTITIDNPGQYERLTAVVVNADASESRYSQIVGDWLWEKDNEPINARVSADFHAPRVTHRWPAPRTSSVSRYGHVSVTFSERMFELTSGSVRLVGPNGRSVKAKLALTTKGRKARAAAGARKFVLTPQRPLHRGARYELRLSRDLRDYGGNALPASALKFAFRTRR